jgi:hypothetical protein
VSYTDPAYFDWKPSDDLPEGEFAFYKPSELLLAQAEDALQALYWPPLRSNEQEIAEAKPASERAPREAYWLRRYGVAK